MTSSDKLELDASQLDVELELPRSVEEMLLPDVYVGAVWNRSSNHEL